MNGNAAEEYGLLKPRFQEFDNMFRVELFRVNPITDQANQATNQDFERLDFFFLFIFQIHLQIS